LHFSAAVLLVGVAGLLVGVVASVHSRKHGATSQKILGFSLHVVPVTQSASAVQFPPAETAAGSLGRFVVVVVVVVASCPHDLSVDV
jgi:uncharacterized oligopeptide transporter (OPT) family protein